jgi:hypothetical protein
MVHIFQVKRSHIQIFDEYLFSYVAQGISSIANSALK